jgi:hypothetical protein
MTMKARTGVCASLCGTLLLGCTSFPGLSGLFSGSDKTPAIRVAKNADTEYQRGRRLHLAGQYGDAQQAYLSALAIDPSHAEARNGIAALIGASGDLDRAIAMLAELSNNYPAAHVYANLGHAYQLKGMDFSAREAYQHAVDLDPGNELARHRLQALDEKLQAAPVAEASVKEQPVLVPTLASNPIERIGPSIYALRYPLREDSVTAAAPNASTLASPVPGNVQARSPAVTSFGSAQTRALPVELVNANGVTGLARQLRSLLPNDTWRVVRTRNHENFGVSVTRIEYVPMHRREAQQFAQQVGIAARLRPNGELQGAQLRLVLGHDCRSVEQLRQSLASAHPPSDS